jgi:MYXO-CTERM domain-containing protein
MTMIKKLAIALSLVGLVALTQNVGAANISFVGNGYVVLDINGAGNTFYDVNNQSNDNVTPSFDTNNTTPTAFSQVFTINPGTSILLGAQEQTFPSTGGTSAFLGYKITDLTETTGSFTEMNLPFQQHTGSNDQWQQLATTSGVDIGSSLTPGLYLLAVYEHATNGGDVFNNEAGTPGNNWEVEIQVLPEPSTIAAGALAVVGAFFLRRRRATV